MSAAIETNEIAGEIPVGNHAGFVKYFKYDVVSGFLVFLIALPLCLGISLACGYPPLAGMFTAIIGALVPTFISNSELTIKGPAAGLIVIAIGCIESFGGDGMSGGWSAADGAAYKAAIAVGVAAAALQIVAGLIKSGALVDLFPNSAVHGMLASIGVIIIAKQIPVALGVAAKGEPLELLGKIPQFFREANPAIALIGMVSLAIMFIWPVLKSRFAFCKPIPAQLVVLLVAVPMGMGFDLLHEHSYMMQGHKYQLSEQFLVTMPNRPFGMFDEITFPDFSALLQPKAWKWVFIFLMIGTLESALSAKAIDLIDPWKRKTDLNRDIVAVGTANFLTAIVGGLPMISEIVRSRSNIDNGARTRFANMWHGVFLLVCVALIPVLLHKIPLAALASMLIYTGYRLTHPSEFAHAWHIGPEQMAVFVATIVGVLATDLLIGIFIGIGVELFVHIINGVPLTSLLKPSLEVTEQGDNTSVIALSKGATFTNWIPLRRAIENIGLFQKRNIVVDLSNTKLVDHSTMNKLSDMERDFKREGLTLEIIGLDDHKQFSKHAQAARKRVLVKS